MAWYLLWFRNASPDRCGRAGSSRYHRTFTAERLRSAASHARDVGTARRAARVGGALLGSPWSVLPFFPAAREGLHAPAGDRLRSCRRLSRTPVSEALLVSVVAIEVGR